MLPAQAGPERCAERADSAPYPGTFALPPEGEAVYAALLKSAPASMTDVLAHAEDPVLARVWLDRLAGLGLIWRDSADLIHPSPPRAAAEAWAAKRELEAAQARESAHSLAQLYAA